MIARFQPPTPNCGHVEGVTFTHDPDRDLWFCMRCLVSLGAVGIRPRCTRCGGPLPAEAVRSAFASRVCVTCQINANAEMRARAS